MDRKTSNFSSTLQEKLEGISNERVIHYSLDRFHSVLNAVGNPEKSVKTMVTAGTNGKGTTSLLLSSAIEASGARVGTYLSPHLQSPNERLLHNLVPVEEAEFEALVDEFKPLADKFRLTYFEFLTLVAFLWAQRAELDFLVLEVGLGGRLDATNVTTPIASLITNIDWDHQQWLGDSLEAIFNEKFAVVPPESLCFTGIKQRKLGEELIRRCDAIDTIYYFTRELRVVEGISRDWFGQSFSINGFPFSSVCPTPGAVQSTLLAYLAARIVFPKLSVPQLQEAFARVKNPGRFEVVQEDPLVILSGDHNPAGVECLLQTLEQLPKKGDLRILCAFSPDKPFQAMFERLKNVASEITLTIIPRLRDALPASYFEMAKVHYDPVEALESLILRSGKDDVVLVTGSLYLVGEVRSLWKRRADFLTNPKLHHLPAVSKSDVPNPTTPRQEEVPQTNAPTSRGAAP